jgi:hypothetical protein
MRSPTSRIAAMSAAASSPRFLRAAISSLAALRRAFSCSVSWSTASRRSSMA